MADRFDLVIRAHRVLLPGLGERRRAVGIRDGRIEAIEPPAAPLSAAKQIELGDDVVLMPGLVDSHVHVCEPGHTQWEGFATATRAAAAGGITTLVDMPLDSVPVTVDVAALELKQQAAAGRCYIDVAFWGGVIPGNLGQLTSLWRAGVAGFKCFLADSGSADFPPVDVATMTEALRVARGLGAPLIVHAESNEVAASLPAAPGSRYSDFLASRPRGLENLAVAQVIEAARRTGGHAHICHLSSSDALPMIGSARREGVSLTAESCPHYLTLCAEDIADGETVCKCSPPIREAANRELLWDGLRARILGLVVSDHSPCTADMKTGGGGDFAAAWGGISSLQFTLPLVWGGARTRGFSLGDVAAWMSQGPAELAGLRGKGRIGLGQDADFCIFAPDETFVVDPAECHHRNPGTPYDGRTLTGVVRGTILRGERVGPARPRGRLLARSAA
jgi:allantoinase